MKTYEELSDENEKLHKALEIICVRGLRIMSTRAEYKRAFYGGYFNDLENRPSYKKLVITRYNNDH